MQKYATLHALINNFMAFINIFFSLKKQNNNHNTTLSDS